MILISENDMLNSANLQGAGPREYKKREILSKFRDSEE